MPTVVTADRAVILHLAGRHRLSPALRDGAPVLLGPGDVTGRCGWEPFFRALQERRQAIAFEEDGAARAVAGAGAAVAIAGLAVMTVGRNYNLGVLICGAGLVVAVMAVIIRLMMVYIGDKAK